MCILDYVMLLADSGPALFECQTQVIESQTTSGGDDQQETAQQRAQDHGCHHRHLTNFCEIMQISDFIIPRITTTIEYQHLPPKASSNINNIISEILLIAI